MAEPKITPELRSRVAVRPQVMGRIRVSQLLGMAEPEFVRLLREIEEDPLFLALSGAEGTGPRLIGYQPAPRTSLSPRFYEEPKEEAWASNESFDVEGFLHERQSALQIIRRVGRERFEDHFLYGRSGKNLTEAAAECGLSPSEAQALGHFVLEFSSRAEFFNPSGLARSGTQRFTLVGEIVNKGGFNVNFFSPHWIRGKYVVDETGLKVWCQAQALGKDQRSRLRSLLERIRLINIRHSAFVRILLKAIDLQHDYLESRDVGRMASASAETLARQLSLAPSTVSRSISGKSVLLPWKSEVPVSHLLPGRHKVLMIAIKKVQESTSRPLTDTQLAEEIHRLFHLKASRRTINACRHELSGS